jgi:3-oxoacyl-[acyl-carrier-protein] synthase II
VVSAVFQAVKVLARLTYWSLVIRYKDVTCAGISAGARLRTSLRLRAASQHDPDKTIVVTGVGVVSPVGIGADIFYDNLCNGVCGLSRITKFDPSPYKCQIGGEVKDFDPKQFYKAPKKIKQNDLCTHFAVAASHLAVKDANLDMSSGNICLSITTYLTDICIIAGATDGNRVGVIIGSAFGGMRSFEDGVHTLRDSGPLTVDPYLIPMVLGNTPAGVVGMELGAKGPNFGIQTACASATHALGAALRLMRNGDADVMVVGGAEAPLTPLSFAGFCNLMAMNTGKNDNPTEASSPFDKRRSGFVMSEGGGVVVLETLSHATKRKARIYCELAGYGASCDAHHITAPEPTGDGLKRAIEAALTDSAVKPEEVDYINAHGTSTKKNDQIETLALKRVFGEHAKKLYISSIKGSTGHTLGAAGGLEAVACAKAFEKMVLPPTINYKEADPECDLNYCPNKVYCLVYIITGTLLIIQLHLGRCCGQIRCDRIPEFRVRWS